jgi:hypothetical protein
MGKKGFPHSLDVTLEKLKMPAIFEPQRMTLVLTRKGKKAQHSREFFVSGRETALGETLSSKITLFRDKSGTYESKGYELCLMLSGSTSSVARMVFDVSAYASIDGAAHTITLYGSGKKPKSKGAIDPSDVRVTLTTTCRLLGAESAGGEGSEFSFVSDSKSERNITPKPASANPFGDVALSKSIDQAPAELRQASSNPFAAGATTLTSAHGSSSSVSSNPFGPPQPAASRTAGDASSDPPIDAVKPLNPFAASTTSTAAVAASHTRESSQDLSGFDSSRRPPSSGSLAASSGLAAVQECEEADYDGSFEAQRIERLEIALEKALDDNELLETRSSELALRVEAAEAARLAATSETEALLEKLRDSDLLRDSMSHLEAERDSAIAKLAELEAALEGTRDYDLLRESAALLEAERDEVSAKLAEAEAALEGTRDYDLLRKSVALLEAERDEVSAKLAEAEAAVEGSLSAEDTQEFLAKVGEMEQGLDEMQEALSKLQAERDLLLAEKATMNAELDEVRMRATDAEELAGMKERLAGAEQLLVEAEGEMLSLMEKHASEVEQLQSELAASQELSRTAEADASELRKQIAATSGAAAALSAGATASHHRRISSGGSVKDRARLFEAGETVGDESGAGAGSVAAAAVGAGVVGGVTGAAVSSVHSDKEKDSLKKEIENLRLKVSGLSTDAAAANERTVLAEARCVQQDELHKAELAEVKGRLMEAENLLRDAEKEMVALESAAGAATEMDSLKVEVEALRRRVSELSTDADAANERIAVAEARCMEQDELHQAELAAMKGRLMEAEDLLREAEKEMALLAEAPAALKAELEESRMQLAAAAAAGAAVPAAAVGEGSAHHRKFSSGSIKDRVKLYESANMTDEQDASQENNGHAAMAAVGGGALGAAGATYRAEREAEALKKEIATLKLDLKAARAELASKLEEVEAAQCAAEEERRKLAEVEARAASSEHDVLVLKEKVATLTRMHQSAESLSARVTELEGELQSRESNAATEKRVQDELDNLREENEVQLQSWQRMCDEIQKEKDEQAQELISLKMQIAQLSLEYDEVRLKLRQEEPEMKEEQREPGKLKRWASKRF